MALPVQVNNNQNLCLSEFSTEQELDLLFNSKDGILADDTFIGIMGDAGDDLAIDKAFDADDLFSQLLNVDTLEPNINTTQNPLDDHAYYRDQQLSRSPLTSDSGISDSCQRSPEYVMSDSQSEPSPGQPEDISLEGVLLETVDFSSVFSGNDPMLCHDNIVSTATQDMSDDEHSNGSVHVETLGYESNFRLTATESTKETLPMTMQNIQQDTHYVCNDANSKYHLVLTDEEKRLLKDMSVQLPTDMPLTKEEERSLKAVRRKIRNKASAQNSRQKKKVYVDGLEHRVQMCTRHNLVLQKKMDKLEKDNRTLLDQLKSLQKLVAKGTTKAAQASTCVMVLLFSFALLVAPSFNPFSSSGTQESYEPNGVVGRTLMHVDVPDADLLHSDPINLGNPAQSYATDKPMMSRSGRPMMMEEEEEESFPSEDAVVKAKVVEKDTTNSEEGLSSGNKVESVVVSQGEAKKNETVANMNKNDLPESEKVVASHPQTIHHAEEEKTKTTPSGGKVKHAGDEM